MAFCINCGQELAEGAKFCANCGKVVNATQNDKNNQRKTVYDGEIHKCPNCGEVLDSFVANCPSCGYEVRGATNSHAVQDFATKLSKATNCQEKVSIIRNFPIPNTKEDIWEFMIFASSNIDNNPKNELSAAWQSKIEQAYQKAQLVFFDEKEFSRIQDKYNQITSKLNKKKKLQSIKNIGSLLSELMPILPNIIIIVCWLISLFVILPLCRTNLDNVGFNPLQLIFMIDLIAGAIFIPLSFRCESALPKLIATFGLGLTIVFLIPLCTQNLDNVGFNAFQLILFVDIVCSIIIFVRMFKNKNNTSTNKKHLNGISLIISLICVIIFLAVYGIGSLMVSNSEKDSLVDQALESNEITDVNKGIYTYEIRNYVGKNVASIGKSQDNYLVDEYGSGELRIVLVTENGIIITGEDNVLRKDYTVVDQSIPAGSKITMVHLRDSSGDPYSNLVDYQSYDEIILFVAPIGNTSYKPSYTAILPTLDRHTYHIRDYVGRNTASFGNYCDNDRIDEYGEGKLRISFATEDGSYVDFKNENILKCYIVTGQDIKANTELKLEYETDSRGKEYNNLIRSQNYEEITLTVKRLDNTLIEKMPEIEEVNPLYDKINIKKCSLYINSYWNEKDSDKERRSFVTNKYGDETVNLTIKYPVESDNNYDVSINGLVSDNENMIKNIEEEHTSCEVTETEKIKSVSGIEGVLYKYRFTSGFFNKKESSGYLFCFPSPEDRRWFYISMDLESNDHKEEYQNDYMNIIDSIYLED